VDRLRRARALTGARWTARSGRAVDDEGTAMTTEAPTGTTADDRILREELQLATRNHGMPLEALHHDVTPVGLHYLLIHYDIPVVDAASWALAIGGAVERPLTVTLEDLWAREAVTRPVTMECAGNGRARLSPRALSQPWLLEAVGTGHWTGTPVWPLLDEAGLADDVVDVVFTGLDRGVEGGVEQHYARALTPEQLRLEDALLVYELNGAPLPPQHGFPVRLLVPGWYGMTSVKWLTSIEASTAAFAGYQQARAYRYRTEPDETGEPVTRMAVRSLLAPPGVPDFFTRRRHLRPGDVTLTGRAWRSAPTAAQPGPTPTSSRPRSTSRGSAGGRCGGQRRASTSCCAGRPTAPARPSRSSIAGTSAATPSTPCTGCR
jgi:DMSO/TMAO reductase YedYZ molybdopterin-dependent catalytic subunit